MLAMQMLARKRKSNQIKNTTIMSRIILHTCLNAEDNAMLQALYSRSADSVADHLEKLEKVGSSKFMSQYYLGYGHASIGDCGSETIYLEGISMLAAKAIEDNPLFVGQECSSRYIDFSYQPFWDPSEKNSEESGRVANLYTKFRSFYTESLEPLKAHLKTIFPMQENDKSAVYEKAIAARAFDILRGFLPAGATTNVAWTARLSNAGEHLVWMMHHPLEEVRKLGHQAYYLLWNKYPNSFHQEYACLAEYESYEWEAKLRRLEGGEKFEYLSHPDNFYVAEILNDDWDIVASEDNLKIHIEMEEGYTPANDGKLEKRPRKAKLHKHGFHTQVSVDVNMVCDFGSFRDLQRHRNGYCSMPLLDANNGLHPWYMEQLTPELQGAALDLLCAVREHVNKVQAELDSKSDLEIYQGLCKLQYIAPMGTLVGVYLKYSLQQLLYVGELRSGKTVHATLRPFAQTMCEFLQDHGVAVFYDKDESDWTIKRGEQDIVAKS